LITVVTLLDWLRKSTMFWAIVMTLVTGKAMQHSHRRRIMGMVLKQGLPKWLQDGQSAIIFGTKQPQQSSENLQAEASQQEPEEKQPDEPPPKK
jgi:hypothetical protein